MFTHENRPILGIVFVITGVVLGLLVGVIIKKTATEVNLVTTLFYRFVFSVPLLLLFAILGRGKAALNIIEKISGDKLNQSSIKATVEDVSKKNVGKYL